MADEICWINLEMMHKAQEGKTLEQCGQEFSQAMSAAAQGRWQEAPDWIAASIDGDPSADGVAL